MYSIKVFTVAAILSVAGLFTQRPLRYYILMDKTALGSQQYELIKSYNANSFLVTYKCHCYAGSHDLEFIFNKSQKNNITLESEPIPELISFDDFIKIANNAFQHTRSINYGDVYLIEPITGNKYVSYKVVFLKAENKE